MMMMPDTPIEFRCPSGYVIVNGRCVKGGTVAPEPKPAAPPPPEPTPSPGPPPAPSGPFPEAGPPPAGAMEPGQIDMMARQEAMRRLRQRYAKTGGPAGPAPAPEGMMQQ